MVILVVPLAAIIAFLAARLFARQAPADAEPTGSRAEHGKGAFTS
jgi:hypothetical protein